MIHKCEIETLYLESILHLLSRYSWHQGLWLRDLDHDLYAKISCKGGGGLAAIYVLFLNRY